MHASKRNRSRDKRRKRREKRKLFDGTKLKTLREARSLTIEALAERLGRSHQTIRNWESGVYEPDTSDLALLARELDTSMESLIARGAA